jgi:hypothetical protein
MLLHEAVHPLSSYVSSSSKIQLHYWSICWCAMLGDSNVALEIVFHFGSLRIAVIRERTLALSVEYGGTGHTARKWRHLFDLWQSSPALLLLKTKVQPSQSLKVLAGCKL